MDHPGFFDRAGPFSLGKVAKATGAAISNGADPAMFIGDVRPLSDASTHHLSILDNRKYVGQLKQTGVGACLSLPALAS